MSTKQEADAARIGAVALIMFAGGFLLARQLPSAMPKAFGLSYLESFYEMLESVAVMGSPAQLMVALIGLCLYPALNRASRPEKTEAVGSSAPSTLESARRGGPGSHSIQLESPPKDSNQARNSGTGFFKRLRRALSDGRAQARQLCGRNGSLQSAVSSLSRKRSFGSRSSKSEDVLSSRLSMDSAVRAAQLSAGSGGRRGVLQRKASGGGVAGSRWQPSMSRIASGQHLADMAPSSSSISSVTAGKRLEILSYNGFQAVDCLSHEMTDPAFTSVRQVVTDTHLLQFGALIGEASAELALSQAASARPVSPDPASLFGAFDRPELYRQGWELIAEEHKPGLHYWNWRRHLRRGLYMYKSKTIYETATTQQIMDFTYDVEFRRTWDDSVACQLAITPPPEAAAAAGAAAAAAGGGAAGASGVLSLAEAEAKSCGGRSAFMYARTKFPPPMASREYTYARRCWAKPDDGGCYCISRACAHPAPPQAGGRAVRVADFVSGYVIRSSKGVFDTANPAVEVVNVYFEDPCVPSGIVNMSIRRALWPMVQKAEAAFRDYLLTRVHGNLEQPPPERAVALDAFGAAMGGATAARAARVAAADADAASCMAGLPSACRRSWALASPYMLMFRGYMAAWRGGRGALLSALGAAMSLWCNATGLAVGAVALVRGSGRAAVAACRTLLDSTTQPRTGQAARVLARLMWPWEALVRGRGAAGQGAGGSEESKGSSGGSSGSSGGRLASHPLPRGSAGQGAKRLSFAPGTGGEDGSASSPRGPRRPRGGLVRRCAMLAVKVAKVAGAGLLLGRVSRAVETSDSGASGASGGAGTSAAAAAAATGSPGQRNPRLHLQVLRPSAAGPAVRAAPGSR